MCKDQEVKVHMAFQGKAGDHGPLSAGLTHAQHPMPFPVKSLVSREDTTRETSLETSVQEAACTAWSQNHPWRVAVPLNTHALTA